MSNTATRRALVTGANKGIGFAIAAGLGARGWQIGVGARDDARREDAVRRLREDGINAFGVPLDVTSDHSVQAAAELVEREAGGLDVLINNAAITGGMPQEPASVRLDQVKAAVDANVFGVIRVTEAMLGLLRRSTGARIVNVSSGVGSLTLQSDPDAFTGPLSLAYSPSKTYLNAITVQYAKALAGTGILVNAVCPGYIATDLNGHRGTGTPQDGARSAIQLATIDGNGPTGGFFNAEGPLPW